MSYRTPILTQADHRNLDAFLRAILDDLQNGVITKEQVVGGLTQAIGALDKGNHGEVSHWFEQGRKQIRSAI